MSTPTNTWVKVNQPNNPYFYNFVTKQTTRRKPQEYQADEKLLSQLRRKQKVIVSEHIADSWYICIDNFGNWFWHNKTTGKSEWQIPEEQSSLLLAKYHSTVENLKATQKEDKKESVIEISAPDDTWIAVKPGEQAGGLQHDGPVEEMSPDEDDAAEDEFEGFDIDFQLQQMEEEEPANVQVGPSENQIASYHELLASLGVTPFTVYESILPQLKTDHRYIQLNHKTAKTLFEEFCRIATANVSTRSHDHAYMELLRSEVKQKMRWELFQKKFKRDSRFRNMGAREREKLFKQHIEILENPEKALEPKPKTLTKEERERLAVEARLKEAEAASKKIEQKAHAGKNRLLHTDAVIIYKQLLVDHISMKHGQMDLDDALKRVEQDTRYSEVEILSQREKDKLMEDHFMMLRQKLIAKFHQTLRGHGVSEQNYPDVNTLSDLLEGDALFMMLKDSMDQNELDEIYRIFLKQERRRILDDFDALLKERTGQLKYKFVSAESGVTAEDDEEGLSGRLAVPAATDNKKQVQLHDAVHLLEDDSRYEAMKGYEIEKELKLSQWLEETREKVAREKFQLPLK